MGEEVLKKVLYLSQQSNGKQSKRSNISIYLDMGKIIIIRNSMWLLLERGEELGVTWQGNIFFVTSPAEL